MSLISIGTVFTLVCVIFINFSYTDSAHSDDDILSDWMSDLAFGQDSTSNVPIEYSIYVDEKNGFALEYPSYWSYGKGELPNTPNGVQLLFLDSNDDTRITIAKKINDFDFRNLPEESFLNKIMENEEEFCRVLTMDEYSYTCSNFKPTLSTFIEDPKFPAYVVGYTYTAQFKDGTSENYSTLKLQIPDHDNTWRIIVSEPEANVLNHPEEIASVLNSFTILDPVFLSCTFGEVLEDGQCISSGITFEILLVVIIIVITAVIITVGIVFYLKFQNKNSTSLKQTKFCGKCGTRVTTKGKFCRKCGNSTHPISV